MAADDFLTNSSLMPSEYAAPVLGFLFLRQTGAWFSAVVQRLGGGVVDAVSSLPDDHKAASSQAQRAWR